MSDASSWRVEELTREIAAHAQTKRLDAALESWTAIESEGLKPSMHTYAAMINAHVVSGDVAGAEQLMRRMRAAGFRPNIVVYTTVLKGHCAAGDLEAAQALLHAMIRASPPVRPDHRTVNTFLRGCVRVGDLAAARWAWGMIETPWRLKPSDTATVAFGRLLSQVCVNR
jgi:pentatricopeptide repeat protein